MIFNSLSGPEGGDKLEDPVPSDYRSIIYWRRRIKCLSTLLEIIPNELLERDMYKEGEKERHELLDIVSNLLSLADKR